MNKIHVHSPYVRLNKETNNIEINCHDPKCCYKVNYHHTMVTLRELFGKEVANLLAKKKD